MARPRQPDIDTSVLAAALELFLAHGVAGVEFLAVSRRAGVSRQSVYRRWGSREDLIRDALDHVPVDLPEPVGATLRDRLVSLFATVDQAATARRLSLLVNRLAAGSSEHPELTVRGIERFVEPRRRQLHDELARGQRRGELRADLDLDLLADTLAAPLLFRFLIAAETFIGGEQGSSAPQAGAVAAVPSGAASGALERRSNDVEEHRTACDIGSHGRPVSPDDLVDLVLRGAAP